jgi:hypothetical protein
MSTRIFAFRRLVNLYIEQLFASPDYHLQTCIADGLTKEHIGVVQDLSLYPEMEKAPAAEMMLDYDRDMRVLRAWLSSPQGSLQ